MQTNRVTSRVCPQGSPNSSAALPPSKTILAVAGFALAFAVAACAQGLGPLTPMDRVHFQIGVTRKNEVANTLGLPTSRRVEQGYEYWDYPAGPAVSSIDLPIVTGSPTAPIATTERFEVGEQQATVLVCVFGSDGVLSSVRDLRGTR
jgi:hypothetical protein